MVVTDLEQMEYIPIKPSLPARLAQLLPFGSAFVFTYYNRLFRNLIPIQNGVTSFGSLLICDNRDFIQTRIYHFGLWEPNITAVFVAVVKPGDIVVDIGANIGYFTLLAAKLVGPTGSVVAIEASPKIVHLLKNNIAKNAHENIRVENLAVSDRLGHLTIYEAPDSNIGATTTVESRGFKSADLVEARPLDAILTPAELRNVSFIKIDVEGAEAPILNNITEKIALYPSLSHILVEASAHEAPDVWTSLFNRLTRLGFSAMAVDNEYDYKFYLTWQGPKTPQQITSLPLTQSDILFHRPVYVKDDASA